MAVFPQVIATVSFAIVHPSSITPVLRFHLLSFTLLFSCLWSVWFVADAPRGIVPPG